MVWPKPKVAVVYNEPLPGRYAKVGEEKAITGVLEAVDAVQQALVDGGYPVFRFPLLPPREQVKAKLNELKELGTGVIFNLFEGFASQPGSEAQVAELLFELGLPVTGCPPPVIALAQDKVSTKILLAARDIPTPRYQLLRPTTLGHFYLDFPCIVKPMREHASHGLSQDSVVRDRAGLRREVLRITRTYGREALVEEFLSGREFNATVMGWKEPAVLPISEIVYSLPPDLPPVLTYAAKWEPDSPYFASTQAVCPADVTLDEQWHLAGTALMAFRALGCQGYARVDMRLDERGRINVLEVNPNPDISPDTGAARQAKASGMLYPRFIEEIVQLALEDHHDANSPAPLPG